ncbi:MAG: outer membrane beta-barrel protein [Elusimicrobiota bacterium]
MKKRVHMTAALGAMILTAGIAAAQATTPATASDADLRQQVQTLEKRLADLEKSMGGGASAAHAAAAGPTSPVYSWPGSTAAQPFDFADFAWLNGNSREHNNPFDSKYFTPELRLDANYVYDQNHPADHTLDGSCETGRTNEIQVQQFGVGGDLHYEHIRGRVMTQFGMYSQMTPRNDASPSRGQWNLGNAYQYLSEANGGYHWDAWHGINLDAGIFMSYVGLFSYYNADNWAYQPSYVSANTPWFFNGMRLQTFPTDRWKAEFWLTNGWQSYGMFNSNPGLGTQQLWRPTGRLSFLSNDYWGTDVLGNPARQRFHSDNSMEVKYYDVPNAKFLDKAAFSVTLDAGCEDGGGVSCFRSNPAKGPQQDFLGFMVYNRTWFAHDHFALTAGGGAITNPGRYLVLMPAINGATATSGTPYFTENPGDQFKAWDASLTFDYMPDDWVTWRLELDHRAADSPYFAGPGGMTPAGGNQGAPGTVVPGFTPDLVKAENRINLALLIKI